VLGDAIPGLILLQEIGIHDRLAKVDRPLKLGGYNSAGDRSTQRRTQPQCVKEEHLRDKLDQQAGRA